MLIFDTETCGLCGPMVLLQYAQDDGEIKLYNIWKTPIKDTIELLEWIANQEVCGFNLAFDWFHISKIYTMFSMYPDQDAIPEDHIEELAILEEKARFSPLCIKPKAALDLMLHARKGTFQSLMQRNDIRVKRVPTRLAESLQVELERRIELEGIYFARRKDQHAPQWSIRDVHYPDGEINPNFKDIVLKFSASGALKTLAEHALGYKKDVILKIKDVEVDKAWQPKELGYAPFALAISSKKDWTWPDVISNHISHWAYNPLARRYAGDDVKYTRDLYHYFHCPEAGDVDSELACMVGAVRWRGFAVDIPKLKQQKLEAIVAKAEGKIPTAPSGVKGYLNEVMTNLEAKVLNEGTGRIILESIAEWKKDDDKIHPAAIRAKEVLKAREATKEIETLDKLIRAGRFHASFKIIGTLSSRMSGTDGLNPQGIKNTTAIRSCFPLADPDFILSGGDFIAFEITIADAVYEDPDLRADLLAGKKIHALFAQELFDMSYNQVMASKGTDADKYVDGKRGVFGMIYGGTEYTLQTRIGISEEVSIKAYEGFAKKYPGIGKARERIKKMFQSMSQPKGIGTAVEWSEPADYIENLLGFKRYFTLENKIAKALFDLAQNPPESWKKVRIKVQRRDRQQTASGACQSALYASAFAIQGSNMRAAGNHEIQSTGAEITKAVQKKIWDLQPSGVHRWLVQNMNVHDEILCVCSPEMVDKVAEVVNETMESFKPIVPLIAIGWGKELKTWADK